MRLKGWARGRKGKTPKTKEFLKEGMRENEMSKPRAGQAVTDGLGDTEPEQPLNSGSMEM